MRLNTSTTPLTWRRAQAIPGRTSYLVLGVLIVLGLVWLGWPVWGSLSSPDAAQVRDAAGWLLGALTAGLALLGAAIWRDAGYRSGPLGACVALVLAGCGLQVLLNPSGLQFGYALPLVAGIALGAPAGFWTGATTGLLAALVVSTPTAVPPGATLPSQAVVWGLIGAAGGLLVALRPTLAWLVSLPLALVVALAAGVLFNLITWSGEPGVTTVHFFPGLPAGEVIGRVWSNTLETSLVTELTRGAITAVLLALIGHPLISALRPAPRDRPADITAPAPVSATAVARRTDRTRLDRLWNPTDAPTEENRSHGAPDPR